MNRAWVVILLAWIVSVLACAQQPGETVPTVIMAPVGKVQVRPGGSATVELDFRVGSEFHINSNKPKSELLIPTALHLTGPEPLKIAALNYPAGQDMSFPFAPDEKLSVYSGDFTITAVVKASAKAAGGNYPVSGELHFQACDRSACYPPRSIPVRFEVSVIAR
jgi:hypothetical protein